MAIIKKTNNAASGRRNWDLLYTVAMKAVQYYRKQWSFFKKLNVQLPYVPAVSLLGIYPKELKSES